MSFTVTKVIDGDTFKVSPPWKWNDQTGDIVRVNGYDAPEQDRPGYETATHKLKELLFNQEVELRNPIRITYGRLLCDVYYNQQNVADHFSEYR